MDFAKEWVQQFFETPRGSARGEQAQSDAFAWLAANFGQPEEAPDGGQAPRGAGQENAPPPVAVA